MKEADLSNILRVRDILPYIYGTTRLILVINRKFHIGPEFGFYKDYINRRGEFTRFLMKALDDIVYDMEVVGDHVGRKVYKLYVWDVSLEIDILQYENSKYDEKFDYMWTRREHWFEESTKKGEKLWY